MKDIARDVDDQNLRGELESCKHFLTATEKENEIQRVFKFAISNFEPLLLNDKLDYVFKELKCVAKFMFALGFVLKNIENNCNRTKN